MNTFQIDWEVRVNVMHCPINEINAFAIKSAGPLTDLSLLLLLLYYYYYCYYYYYHYYCYYYYYY